MLSSIKDNSINILLEKNKVFKKDYKYFKNCHCDKLTNVDLISFYKTKYIILNNNKFCLKTINFVEGLHNYNIYHYFDNEGFILYLYFNKNLISEFKYKTKIDSETIDGIIYFLLFYKISNSLGNIRNRSFNNLTLNYLIILNPDGFCKLRFLNTKERFKLLSDILNLHYKNLKIG